MADNPVPSGYPAIEAAFRAARQRPPALQATVHAAFRIIGTTEKTALENAAAIIAAAIDAHAATKPEPRYHNRHHVVETLWAMAWLCSIAVDQGLLSSHHAALGVVAMVGHDMHHDGTATPGGVLEARARAVVPILHQAGVSTADADILGDVIVGTEPSLATANAGRLAGTLPTGPRGAAHDALRALANEADVCASLLPGLGPTLSRRLAAEWAASTTPPTVDFGSACSRLAFLQSYPTASPPAHRLGLALARAGCIAAYREAGRHLAGTATPESGCAALDLLPPDRAAQEYAAALDRA